MHRYLSFRNAERRPRDRCGHFDLGQRRVQFALPIPTPWAVMFAPD